MIKKGPGKAHRTGISLIELFEMFPDELASEKWSEFLRWGDNRTCPYCDSLSTKARENRKPMPYFCLDCKKYFSVRTGTVMAKSRIPLQKWAIAIFLYVTNLKGVSSMKLHRVLKITQKSAWFMLHRLREAGRKNIGKYASKLPINNRELIEHIHLMEQELLSERKEKKMKDWIDYPVDKEYWEREMPDMKNITVVMEGTMDQYLRQKRNLGGKKFFRILRKKYGFKDVGGGQKIFNYYPITAEDIRIAGVNGRLN